MQCANQERQVSMKSLAGSGAAATLLVAVASADAALVTIGSATYDPDGAGGNPPRGEFNLVWDDDNNGASLVWLDYTNGALPWHAQAAWASGLEGALTYHLDGYATAWTDAAWRLSGVGTSYNYTDIDTAEMNHLVISELGLWTNNVPSSALNNNPYFDHLVAASYWSNTSGKYYNTQYNYTYPASPAAGMMGLAVRAGSVTPVPVPALGWVAGASLLGLCGWRRGAGRARRTFDSCVRIELEGGGTSRSPTPRRGRRTWTTRRWLSISTTNR